MLDEVGPERGVLLWQRLRDAVLWARAEEDTRSDLFWPGTVAPSWSPGLEAAIADLTEQLAARLGSAALIARACQDISTWAAGVGHSRTAMLYSQAAAEVEPRDAAYAYRAGLRARALADYARAEAWLRRAFVLGRRSEDWETYSLSLGALGALSRQRGNMPAARRYHRRSLKAARNYRLRTIEAEALHHLCVIAFEHHAASEGVHYAWQAFRLYAAEQHPKLPALANDLAWFWMEHDGAFSRAVPVFLQVLRHPLPELDRLYVLAGLARAAGGASRADIYHGAAATVRAMLPAMPDQQGHAPVLLDVAHGAASLGLTHEAESAAEKARDIARQRREAKIEFASEALLDSLRGVAPSAAEPKRRRSEPRLLAPAFTEDQFASDLVSALELPPPL